MTAFTIGKQKKTVELLDDSQPGVGNYDLTNWTKTSQIRTSPKASIGKATRQQRIINVFPGPASYQEVRPSIHLKSGCNYSIGKESRERIFTQIPSPADYQISNKMSNKSPQFSFPKFRNTQRIKEGPGPQQYQINWGIKAKGNIFSKDKRNHSQQTSVFPSATSYHPEKFNIKKQNPKFSFPKTQKFNQQTVKLRQKTQIPGPGAYKDYLIQTNGFKFSKSKHRNYTTLDPGPGAYNITSISFQRPPVTIIGKSPRNTPRYQDSPNPFSYQLPDTSKTKKRSSTLVFDKQSRDTFMKSKIPGVGEYNIPRQSKVNCSAFVTSRNLKQNQESVPGPQHYNPDYNTVRTSFSKLIIGKQKKLCEPINNFPGPASYEINDKKKPKCFSFRRQKDPVIEDSNVGPGKYLLKPTIGIYKGFENTKKPILYI